MDMLENRSRAAPADQSALALGIPTLDDLDPKLLGVMMSGRRRRIGGEQPRSRNLYTPKGLR